MPLRDILSYGGKRTNPFESWQSAPKIKPIISGRMREAILDSFPFRENRDAKSYPAALIIALGETGEKTLRLISGKIAQSNVPGEPNLRGLLIKETPSSLTSEEWSIRVLELQSPSTLIIPKVALNAKRFSAVALFQQVLNYRRYQEWLKESLLDLGNGTQVFFVGCLDEPVSGILGELLQILRNFPEYMGKPGLLSHVVALLSLQSSSVNSLPKQEVFAAYREIGRFTFPGPHRMNFSYGGKQVVFSALLDGLFILEDSFDKKPASEETAEQILADSLFTLIHPSAQKIWENLNVDMAASGRIRHDYHQTVVHSAGIATLHVPISPIKRYLAARLATAAIIGERTNVDEGIVSLKKTTNGGNPQITARRLLTDGPYVHPVFYWILDASSPAYFDIVPNLDQEFVAAFQSQISHSLVRALNQIPADISHLCSSLEWLENHLAHCMNWFHASKPQNANAPERFACQYALTKWHDNVQDVSKDLHAWMQLLFPSPAGESSLREAPVVADWRELVNPSDWKKDRGNDIVQAKNLSSALNSYRKDAEKLLKAGVKDRICRSVAVDSSEDVNEMESFYTESIRPELSRFMNDSKSLFLRIRDRLEWWIRMIPDGNPQLYLVCWPAEAYLGPEPPTEYCFKVDQAANFVDAVYALAFSQTKGIESELTGAWFRRRVNLFVDFLRRAGDAYIRYDQNLASLINNSASRRSYLISRDQTVNRDLVPFVFSETPRSEINELDQGEPSRVTAVSFRLNVPFDTVMFFQDIRHDYVDKSPEKLHLYPQEQTAVNYEKRIWKLDRTRVLLSPDFVSMLADQSLVTIFCQGLINNIISPVQDKTGRNLLWAVTSLENFPVLELAPVAGDGLLTAFKRFVLDLPSETDITQNPHEHFHLSRRMQYLNLVRKYAKENAASPEAHNYRDKIKDEFQYWKKRGEQNDLARSFYVILQCELDEPIWKDW